MTNTSSDGPWISICCDPDKLHPRESPCYQNASLPIQTVFLPDVYDSNITISNMNSSEFLPHYGIPCSDDVSFYLEPYASKNDSFYLMENGTIYVNQSVFGTLNYWLGIEDYCFTARLTENGTESVVFACATPTYNSDYDVRASRYVIMYAILTGISIPFLIATFLVYTILPQLKNIHGVILRIYVAGLIVTHTLLIIVVTKPALLCTYAIGIMLHFAILSNYLWLNVMSFDIWRTFRTFQESSKHRSRKKFIMYSTYAWGLSALITGFGAIIDFIPTLPEGIIRPGLRKGCWFAGETASLIYLHGPVECTIVCNTVFFALTAIKIFRHAKNTAHHFKGQTDEKQRFKLYLKLFVVMGMTDISSVIVSLWKNMPEYVLLILDIPNGLQGVMIFIIFVCKKNIKVLLLQRLRHRSFRPKSSMDKTFPHLPPNDWATTEYQMTTLQENSSISSVQSTTTSDGSN